MKTEGFKQAKWIWNGNATGTDCYCEFVSQVRLDETKPVLFRISADSNYALYINGQFVESGQYADYPDYKVYDEFDIADRMIPGINHIAVIVWYYGVETFNYTIGKPGVIFEAEQDGKVILFSDIDVLSRKSKTYLSGKNQMITAQLGLNFHVDLKESPDWMTGEIFADFQESIICPDMPVNLIRRPVKKLETGELKIGKSVGQGNFSYHDQSGDFGEKMQHASLSFYGQKELYDPQSDEYVSNRAFGEGLFFIVDLSAESTGYLDFEVEVPQDCQMEIGWGEHLVDGRCRTKIGKRNFSATVRLKSGKNRYMNPFRRFGCRYLQFFIHCDRVKIGHLGIRPVTYPLQVKEYKSGNLLRDTIYRVCENTLIQCMHEHYEDCTWREQSFYTLDSRNQMLCGYYAFGEYEFPKASLKLLSKSLKEDGLLTICCPTDCKLKIPSFCLFYIIQLYEYYNYSKDRETVAFCFQTAKTVVDTFVGRIDDCGLIPNFEGENYWNFYEWQPYLDGSEKTMSKRYDMCLNALLSLALDKFAVLCDVVKADKIFYVEKKDKLNCVIKEKLFDEKDGLFKLYYGQTDNIYSVLANALGFLSGALNIEEADNVLEVIKQNGCAANELTVIETSLSMDTFRYEALLKADKEKYKNDILNEIDRVYFDMLCQGATSFWETKKGDSDFHNAGSLCHGWSAMPIYYYENLFSKGEVGICENN